MSVLFVDLDPYFDVQESGDTDEYGHVVLWDAEGEQILRCDPELAKPIAAALEFAHSSLAEDYGDGWLELSNERAASYLRGMSDPKDEAETDRFLTALGTVYREELARKIADECDYRINEFGDDLEKIDFPGLIYQAAAKILSKECNSHANK